MSSPTIPGRLVDLYPTLAEAEAVAERRRRRHLHATVQPVDGGYEVLSRPVTSQERDTAVGWLRNALHQHAPELLETEIAKAEAHGFTDVAVGLAYYQWAPLPTYDFSDDELRDTPDGYEIEGVPA